MSKEPDSSSKRENDIEDPSSRSLSEGTVEEEDSTEEKKSLRKRLAALPLLAKILLGLGLLFVVAAVIAIITTTGEEDLLPDAPPPVVEEPSQNIPQDNQEGAVTGVIVSPTVQEIEGSVGDRIDPVSISNNSADTIDVIVNYVPSAGNTLTGSPVFGISEETIRKGRKQVVPDIKRFQLAPGARRDVGGTIVGEPAPGQAGMYGVMVFSLDVAGDRDIQSREAFRSGVNIRIKKLYRIGAIVTVRFPRAVREDIELQRIRATEDEEGITFSARTKNTGNYLVRPVGEIIISGAEGTVAELPITEQGIVPGNLRDLRSFEPVQGLPPGNYRADGTFRVAGKTVRSRWDFQIDENGNLPSPRAGIAAIAIPNIVQKKEGFEVRVQIRNDGTRDFASIARVDLTTTDNPEIIRSETLEIPEIAPGDKADGTVTFPGIAEAGNYQATVQLDSDDGIDLGTRTTGILVRDTIDKPTFSEELRNWMSANPIATMLVGIGIVGLLVLLGLLLYLLLGRRSRDTEK